MVKTDPFEGIDKVVMSEEDEVATQLGRQSCQSYTPAPALNEPFNPYVPSASTAGFRPGSTAREGYLGAQEWRIVYGLARGRDPITLSGADSRELGLMSLRSSQFLRLSGGARLGSTPHPGQRRRTMLQTHLGCQAWEALYANLCRIMDVWSPILLP
jgi:hypothetical protein